MIIGITGLIGSGKDTAANYLITHHHFKKESFAASLKDAISSVFGWDRDLLEGQSKYSREWREQKDEWWSNRLGMEVTPRWMLQVWGTEVCRNGFHTDIWVASVENKLRKSQDAVVITDCRFKNEVDAIKKAGGITIRIHRGPEPDWCKYAEVYNKRPNSNAQWSLSKTQLDKLSIHASEYSSVGLDYDHHIYNDGSIDELHNTLAQIVYQEQAFSQLV